MKNFDCNFDYLTDAEVEQLFLKIQEERKERVSKQRQSKKEDLNKLLEKAFKIADEYDFDIVVCTDEDGYIVNYEYSIYD